MPLKRIKIVIYECIFKPFILCEQFTLKNAIYSKRIFLFTILFMVTKVWFGLVWFYGISTIVVYLMPNSVLTYILNIRFLNTFHKYRQLKIKQFYF